jgi:hypothetical protein
MFVGFVTVRIPVMLTQMIGGPFDGGVVMLEPGCGLMTMPSELGRWDHYYGLVDGRLEYLGRSDGIEKEVNDATGV